MNSARCNLLIVICALALLSFWPWPMLTARHVPRARGKSACRSLPLNLNLCGKSVGRELGITLPPRLLGK